MPQDDAHYLKRELYDLVRSDESIFDFLQNGSLDGIWYWDLEKPEHEWMNARFWEIFGYAPSSKKHLASEWQDMIHPEDLEVALVNFKAHCADPNHPYDQVVRYQHKDGSTVWVRCRGLAIRGSDGTPRRMLGAHTDITDLKRTEEELRHALESNYELEQFAYVASHDLREPLRMVLSYLDMLTSNEAFVHQDAKKFVERAVKSATRMETLISALLDYSRIAAAEDNYERIAGAELVSRATANLQAMLDETEAELVVEDLPIVEVLPEQIVQVFQNLMSNAINFRDDGAPQIEIAASKDEAYWRFCVRDNGLGIAAKEHERIFQMFQRLQGSRKNGGNGIGLAVAKRIIDRHGGRMWVESAPGAGSSFFFTLPVSPRGSRETRRAQAGGRA